MNIKRFALIAVTVIAVAACAHNRSPSAALEEEFNDYIDWFDLYFEIERAFEYDRSYFAFVVVGEVYKDAERTTSGVKVRTITLSSCKPLQEGLASLYQTLPISMQIAVNSDEEDYEGEREIVVVADGPRYRLIMNSLQSMDRVEFSGGGNAAYRVPWVNAAKDAAITAGSCDAS